MKSFLALAVVLFVLLPAQTATAAPAGSTITYPNSGSYVWPGNSLSLQDNTTIDLAVGADLTISGGISDNDPGNPGPWSFTKTGGGTLILTGSSSFRGGAYLFGGTTILLDPDGLSNGPITMTSEVPGTITELVLGQSLLSGGSSLMGHSASRAHLPNMDTSLNGAPNNTSDVSQPSPEPASICLLLAAGIAILFRRMLRRR